MYVYDNLVDEASSLDTFMMYTIMKFQALKHYDTVVQLEIVFIPAA